MAVRRNTRAGRPSGATRASSQAAKPAARKTAAPARRGAPKQDVTEYASKPPTGYHKAFAAWIVREVGYDPDTARSPRAAFLKGVSIATAARPAFNASDAVEEYREKSGEAKRGPKPTAEKAAPARRRKAAPEPDEFDEDDEFEDDEEDSEDSDEFDEDDDSESDDEEEAEEDDFEEEEEEAPPARTRSTRQPSGTAKASRTAPAKRTSAKKAAPTRRTKAADDDDEFLF